MKNKYLAIIKNKILKAIKSPSIAYNYFRDRVAIQSIKLNNGKQRIPCRNISIYVNGICNCKCTFCDVGQQNLKGEFSNTIRKEELNINTFKKLVDEIKWFRPNLHINGMEPLLYQQIPELILYATQNKLPISITTNGLLLEKYAKQIVENKLTELNVSIDGLGDTHNKTRGINNIFEKNLAGIQEIIKLKKEKNTKYPLIRISCTISELNENELYLFYKYFSKLDIQGITFTHLNYLTVEMAEKHNKLFGNYYLVSPSSLSNLTITKTNYKKIHKNIQKIKKEKNEIETIFSPNMITVTSIKEFYTNPSKLVSKTKCFIPWTHTQILSNGDVVPGSRCHFHKVMGNITNEKFSKVWNSKKYKEFRIWFKKTGFKTPVCSRCCGIF